MNKYATIIAANIVALATGALKFIPKLTAELYGEIIDYICAQLQASKAQFVADESEPDEEVIISMVENGLNAIQAGLDSKQVTKYDTYFETAIGFLSNLSPSGNHPVLAAIKTWFQKTFTKKTTEAAQ